MELGTGTGLRQVSTGLEEEGEGEGVSGEGVAAAEPFHLLVEMDGLLGEAAQRVVPDESIPHSDASMVHVVAVESGDDEYGVHLE